MSKIVYLLCSSCQMPEHIANLPQLQLPRNFNSGKRHHLQCIAPWSSCRLMRRTQLLWSHLYKSLLHSREQRNRLTYFQLFHSLLYLWTVTGTLAHFHFFRDWFFYIFSDLTLLLNTNGKTVISVNSWAEYYRKLWNCPEMSRPYGGDR